MLYQETKAKLKDILTASRYRHSLAVAQVAAELGQCHGVDLDRAYKAGLLHDCAKGLGSEELLQTALAFGIVRDDTELICPDLLHGPVGAMLAWKEYGVNDAEILTAIAAHTLGAEKMGLLSKIIYIADYVEPNRSFPGVEDLRALAPNNLNLAVLRAMDCTIAYVLEQSLPLHPQTVRARNSLLLETAAYTREREEENGPHKKAGCAKV
ncbi:MAG: bis(5'-nucleosyl)-tetraphosphatase (symmetrical) YqeK [bacterium]|jgi:predicted HD superfamily hydrolase involved in NAD metabolism